MTTVNVTEQNSNVTITEGDTPLVTVTEGITTVVTVKEVGPQGPQGALQTGDVGDFTVSVANDGTQSAVINTGAVTSSKILDGTIVNADINASANIASSKLADSGVSSGSYGSGSAIPTITVNDKGIVTGISTNSVNTTTNLSTTTSTTDVTIASSTGNNASISEASGSAAGVMSVAHHNKLDGIENNATADQTAAEIKTLLNSDGIVNAQIASNAAIHGSKINPQFSNNIVINTVFPQIHFNDTDSNSDFKIINANGTFKINDSTNSADRFSIASDGTATFTGNVSISQAVPRLNFIDTGDNPNYQINNTNGVFKILDSSTPADRITIATDGTVTVTGNLNANAGLDVTGNITSTGSLTINNATPLIRLTDTTPSGQTAYDIKNTNSTLRITDSTNGVDRLEIHGNGSIHVSGNFNANSGLDVTGGDITGVLGSAVTGTTQSASDNSTKIATTAYTDTAIANLVSSAPSTLDTLGEIATALNNDAALNTTLTNSIATKLPLAGGTLTGDLTIDKNNPVITFSDNNNNPDYQVGNVNGVLRFQDTTNNATRFQINTDGHIDLNSNVDISGALTITSTLPQINLTDSDNSDWYVANNNGTFRVRNTTNSVDGLMISSSGQVDFAGNVDCNSGLDVTGNTNITGNLVATGNEHKFTAGTSGDLKVILQADTDNNNESDSPHLLFRQDAELDEGAIFLSNNKFNIASTVASGGGINFRTSTTNSGYLTADVRMNITPAGQITMYGNVDCNSGLDVTGDATSTTGFAAGTTSVGTGVRFNAFSDNTHIGHQISIEQDGDGDAVLGWSLTGVRAWSAGIDNSDSNRWKLSSGSSVDTNTQITIEQDGFVGLHHDSASTPKLQTTATGVSIDGSASISNAINLTGAQGDIEATGATGLNLNASNANAYARIRVAGATRLHIKNDGNVGIGNENPSTALDVTGMMRSYAASGGQGTSGLRLQTATEAADIYFSTGNANAQFNITYGGTGGNDIAITHDGTVKLFNGGGTTPKLSTLASGVVVNGELDINGASYARTMYQVSGTDTWSVGLRDSAGGDTNYHIFRESGHTGEVEINAKVNANSGLDVTGNIQMAGTGNILIPDRTSNGVNELRLGNEADYRIYHNGTNAVIDNLTGNFFIKSVDDINFQNRTNNEIMAKFRDDDACELYFDGGTYSTPKLKTTATGVRVNGNLDIDTGMLIIDTNADSPNTSYGLQEAIRIDDAGTLGDRNFSVYEYRQGGMRYFSLNYNLASSSTGSAYQYTQGNYAGSSMLRFDGTFKFYADAEVTAGSTDVITPTERFRVDTDGADVFGNLYITSAIPQIFLTDTGDNPDYVIQNNNGQFRIYDSTNNASRLTLTATGLGVTGTVVATGDGTFDDLRIGEWAGNSSFAGVLHKNQSGSEYMMISNGSSTSGHTYISATTGMNVVIRGGNNSSTNQIEVRPTGGINLTAANNVNILDGNIDFGSNADNNPVISMKGDNNRVKYRVFTNTDFGTGFSGNITHGGLNGFCMTFQVSDTANRGWLFLDSGHSLSQGAMALTTEGKMNVAHSLRLGYGESDTTTSGATYALDVSGDANITGTLEAKALRFGDSHVKRISVDYRGETTGTSTEPYLEDNEFQEILTITPSSASQNYSVIGRIMAASGANVHTIDINVALRSNTLPNLQVSGSYISTITGSHEFLTPRFWLKTTSTGANDPAAFKLVVEINVQIFGRVTADLEIIARSEADLNNIVVNEDETSEVLNIPTDYAQTTPTKVYETDDGAFSFDGNLTVGGFIDLSTSSNPLINMKTNGTRDKYRLWSGTSAYAIGFDNGMSFGGLNDYATTFQMNSDSDRGWVFLDTSHSDAQGAMALTTQGKMTVAHSLRLGYGETDTTTPAATVNANAENGPIGGNYSLDVSGKMRVIGGTLGTTAGDQLELAYFKSIPNSNRSHLSIFQQRDTDGTDWTSAYTRIQQFIDVTPMGYIQFNGTDNTNGMEFGRGPGGVKFIFCDFGGPVKLYHDGVERFSTDTTGANVLNGSLGTNDEIYMKIGRNEAASNTAIVGFKYSGTSGSSDNKAIIGVHGNRELITASSNAIALARNTTVTGTVTCTSLTETSDIALKENIQPLSNVLDKVKQLTGYKYNFKNKEKVSMGVIAQDVEKVFPELVHGEEGKKSLQYSGLVGALIEAVKELSAKVAVLESK